MLVLSRKQDESIIIDGHIVVSVVDIDRGKVRLGIEAPREITVDRHEVHERRTGEGYHHDLGEAGA